MEVFTSPLTERVDIESAIRPVTTTTFGKYYQEHPYDFPNLHVDGKNSVWSQDPINTRVVVQNSLLIRRHFDK